MLYINEGFLGGATDFLVHHTVKDIEQTSSDIVISQQEHICESIRAPIGSALVFTQQTMLHQGNQVLEGNKYILRSDVMFKSNYLVELSEHQAQALVHLKRAEGMSGMEAVAEYKKAYRLDPTLE